MDNKPLTHKAEHELKRNLRQCDRELRDLEKMPADGLTIRLKKYWRSRRARLRAYLRFNENLKAAHVDTSVKLLSSDSFTLN